MESALRRHGIVLGLAALSCIGCAEPAPPVAAPMQAAISHPEIARAREQGSLETYRAADGQELAYVAYRSPDLPTDTAIVQLPGLESHAGWFARAALRLRDLGYHVYSLDRRGTGLNREHRNLVSGDAASADILVGDLAAFIEPLRSHYERVFLIGVSWGVKPALAYALAYPDDIDGLILVTPEPAPPLADDTATRARLAVASLLEQPATVEIGTAPEMLSTDPASLAFMRNDPLRLRSVTPDFIKASRELDERIRVAASARRTPTLLYLSRLEPIADDSTRSELMQAQAPLDILIHDRSTRVLELDTPDQLATDIDRWLQTRRGAMGP